MHLKLSALYTNPSTSPLRAQIKEGANEIPAFRLQK
jgi:hypothetical protein